LIFWPHSELIGLTAWIYFAAGVFKDILLISSSTLFFGSVISPLQIVGQSVFAVPLARSILKMEFVLSIQVTSSHW
jgi:hypothetical protein